MCEPVGSQGNVTYCSWSCGDSLFHKKQTSFGESQQHCSLQTSCQETESDNPSGPSIKAAFPYTQCCFHVVCESSDPESPQIPKEDRISCYSGCGIVVLASLVVFLLIVPVVPFSHISLLLLSLSPWPGLVPYLQVCSWHVSSVWPLCTNLISFSLGISHFCAPPLSCGLQIILKTVVYTCGCLASECGCTCMHMTLESNSTA